MFLTKKELTKIRLSTIAYFALGVLCYLLVYYFDCPDILTYLVRLLGHICIGFGVVLALSGRYGQGTGTLIQSANKLIMQELRPADFIRLYEEKSSCPDNVIAKPSFDTLNMMVLAYDALGDSDRALSILEQMLSFPSEKNWLIANTMKAAVLYDAGRIEEGEAIYTEIIKVKKNWYAKMLIDALTRADRAMAIGDYATAEAYYEEVQTKKFPKQTPYTTLSRYFNLAKIYSMTNRIDKARIYLDYCIENGGQTGIKTEAAEKLKELSGY